MSAIVGYYKQIAKDIYFYPKVRNASISLFGNAAFFALVFVKLFKYETTVFSTVRRYVSLSQLDRRLKTLSSVVSSLFFSIFVVSYWVGTAFQLYRKVLKIRELQKSLYIEYKKTKHSLPNDKNLPAIMIFQAAHDSNGALEVDKRYIFEHLEGKYKLYFYTIKQARDIEKAMVNMKVGEQIAALWIIAHGSPGSMTLSKIDDSFLEYFNVRQLSAFIDGRLDPNAIGVLISCATGKSDDKERNIADVLAAKINRKVFAPTTNIAPFNIIIDQVEPLKVQFRTIFGSDITHVGQPSSVN